MQRGLLFLVVATTLALYACNQRSHTTFAVKLMYNNQPIECGSLITIGEHNFTAENLLFYLSAFNIDNKPVQIFNNSAISQTGVTLLGFRCSSSTNWSSLKVTLLPNKDRAQAEKVTLAFTLGVPENLNHQNPLLAEPPLTASDMFWTWQQGYKFLRLDLNGFDSAENWSFHLGSFGCQSSSSQRPPEQPCQTSNRYRLTIAQYRLGDDVVLHIDELLAGVVTSGKNCMGNPSSIACKPVLENLTKGQLHLFSAATNATY